MRERLKFPQDKLAKDRGVQSYWIDYGSRDRLGSIRFFQGEWHAEFRFNGKDFTFRTASLLIAQQLIKEEISAEYKAANTKNPI